MPRSIVLGNGKLLVNFDSNSVMRDLYYPTLGSPNHIVSRRNVIGVWANEKFSWLSDSEWTRNLRYEEDTLVAASQLTSSSLGLELIIYEAVHPARDVFLRNVAVRDLSGVSREVRLFFCADLDIEGNDVGDCAFYEPSMGVVCHYKRHYWFLFSGACDGRGISQYSCGQKRYGWAEGTWRDAEDGVLEGSPVSHGAVDSVIRLDIILDSGGTSSVDYWMAAGQSLEDVKALHEWVMERGVSKTIQECREYWKNWLAKQNSLMECSTAARLSPEAISLYKRSLLVIRTQIDSGGGILAANDSDILYFNRDHYGYVWARDGVLVAEALVNAGYSYLALQFVRFLTRVSTLNGFLWQRYHADGSVGSSWHRWVNSMPVQEDETALLLWLVERIYSKRFNLEWLGRVMERMVESLACSILNFRDESTKLPLSSYDLWEERFGVFLWTGCTCVAALEAASKLFGSLGRRDLQRHYADAVQEVKTALLDRFYDPKLQRFVRGYVVQDGEGLARDVSLDASAAAVWLFGVLQPRDSRVVNTVSGVQSELWVQTQVGGIARYAGDSYMRRSDDYERVPGNPWTICTLWLALWYIEVASRDEELAPARELLEWAARYCTSTGILPEQVDPYSGTPVSVAPLTWAHGTYVCAVQRYVERAKKLKERSCL